MQNSDKVFNKISKRKNTEYPLLVPNLIGFKNAVKSKVKTICVFTTASELFQKNTNCSVEQSKEHIKTFSRSNKHKMKVRAYISCVLGCPYEGKVSYKTSKLTKFLVEQGASGFLGDTVGYGTPNETKIN